MVDIFDEVNEELNRDKAHAQLKKYGPALMAIAVSVILGAAGWQFYKHTQVKKAEEHYVELRSALDMAAEGKVFESEAALAELKSKAGGGYGMVARFLEATQLGQRSAEDGAKAFEALANDGSLAQEYRHVAIIRAAWLGLEVWDYAKLQSFLAPVLAADNAFRHLAREIMAYSAQKNGQTAEAKRWMGLSLGDLQAPKTTRERMAKFSEMLPAE